MLHLMFVYHRKPTWRFSRILWQKLVFVDAILGSKGWASSDLEIGGCTGGTGVSDLQKDSFTQLHEQLIWVTEATLWPCRKLESSFNDFRFVVLNGIVIRDVFTGKSTWLFAKVQLLQKQIATYCHVVTDFQALYNMYSSLKLRGKL